MLLAIAAQFIAPYTSKRLAGLDGRPTRVPSSLRNDARAALALEGMPASDSDSDDENRKAQCDAVSNDHASASPYNPAERLPRFTARAW